MSLSSSSDSSGANWRSVARSSTRSPIARRRATGNGGSDRLAIATWTTGGASSTNRMTLSWHSSFSMTW